MTQFEAQVFQNEYLPDGGDVIDAVVTVTAVAGGTEVKQAAEVIEVIAVDVSGSMNEQGGAKICLLYTSPSPRDGLLSRMPSSA